MKLEFQEYTTRKIITYTATWMAPGSGTGTVPIPTWAVAAAANSATCAAVATWAGGRRKASIPYSGQINAVERLRQELPACNRT